MKKIMIKLNKNILLLLFNIIIGQSQYQIINLPDNLFQLSSNTGLSALIDYNSTSNPASLIIGNNQSYSFINYPSDIKFANFSVQNFSISILNYGILQDELDNTVNKKFNAGDYLLKYYYNKEFENNLRVGVTVGGYYSQIYTYKSFGIISSIGINKFFKTKNFGLGFSIENLGTILQNYTNTNVPLPSRYSLNLYYKYQKMIFGYNILYYIDDYHIQQIYSLQFNINKNLFLQISNSSYQNSLSVNDDYKYLYGFSGGIGFRVKNNLITVGFKNLGKAGSAFGITINRLLNKNFK